MNLIVISASMRKNSQSLKVSNWLAEHSKNLGDNSTVLDLHELKLPIYDVGETDAPNWPVISKMLQGADAAVFVSPEWNGMMSQGLVNMLQYVGSELAHKPVMLTGVSSTRGGQYPVMQMRIIGYKNNHYVISPENLVVQGVNSAFNDHDMNESATDLALKKRADYGLKMLAEYAKALRQVRDSGVVNFEEFENGV